MIISMKPIEKKRKTAEKMNKKRDSGSPNDEYFHKEE